MRHRSGNCDDVTKASRRLSKSLDRTATALNIAPTDLDDADSKKLVKIFASLKKSVNSITVKLQASANVQAQATGSLGQVLPVSLFSTLSFVDRCSHSTLFAATRD